MYWNSQENAKMWRKDLADTINAANEQLGIAVHWEHRSFKEQGIDREPTIHIGAGANALERKGILTERGSSNREIIKNNMLLASRTGNRSERNGRRRKFNVNFVVKTDVFLYN